MSYYKSIKLLGMEAIAKLFMLIVTPFVTFILHVLTCGVFAWFIGLFFGDGILEILSSLGIEGFSMWQIGIFMGFFSGFFKRMITFSDNRITINFNYSMCYKCISTFICYYIIFLYLFT